MPRQNSGWLLWKLAACQVSNRKMSFFDPSAGWGRAAAELRQDAAATKSDIWGQVAPSRLDIYDRK